MTNLSNEMIEKIKAKGRVHADGYRYVLHFDYILDPWPKGYTIKRWRMEDLEAYWNQDITPEELEKRAEILLTCEDEDEACTLWHTVDWDLE